MKCPHCNLMLVSYNGNPHSEILIAIDEPSFEDVRIGFPLSGTVGNMIGYELGRIGIPIKTCRVASLLLHAENKSKPCEQYAWENFKKELDNYHKGIIFFGSMFYDMFGITPSYIGLPRDGSKYANTKTIVFFPNPASFMFSGIGELRVGLKNFYDILKSKEEKTDG